jgi:hypothetical protein
VNRSPIHAQRRATTLLLGLALPGAIGVLLCLALFASSLESEPRRPPRGAAQYPPPRMTARTVQPLPPAPAPALAPRPRAPVNPPLSGASPPVLQVALPPACATCPGAANCFPPASTAPVALQPAMPVALPRPCPSGRRTW